MDYLSFLVLPPVQDSPVHFTRIPLEKVGPVAAAIQEFESLKNKTQIFITQFQRSFTNWYDTISLFSP